MIWITSFTSASICWITFAEYRFINNVEYWPRISFYNFIMIKRISIQNWKTIYFECMKYFLKVITNKNNLLCLWIIKCHNSKHVVKNINKWWISSNERNFTIIAKKCHCVLSSLCLLLQEFKIGQTLQIFRLCTKNFNTVIPLKTFIFASHF